MWRCTADGGITCALYSSDMPLATDFAANVASAPAIRDWFNHFLRAATSCHERFMMRTDAILADRAASRKVTALFPAANGRIEVHTIALCRATIL